MTITKELLFTRSEAKEVYAVELLSRLQKEPLIRIFNEDSLKEIRNEPDLFSAISKTVALGKIWPHDATVWRVFTGDNWFLSIESSKELSASGASIIEAQIREILGDLVMKMEDNGKYIYIFKNLDME